MTSDAYASFCKCMDLLQYECGGTLEIGTRVVSGTTLGYVRDIDGVCAQWTAVHGPNTGQCPTIRTGCRCLGAPLAAIGSDEDERHGSSADRVARLIDDLGSPVNGIPMDKDALRIAIDIRSVDVEDMHHDRATRSSCCGRRNRCVCRTSWRIGW